MMWNTGESYIGGLVGAGDRSGNFRSDFNVHYVEVCFHLLPCSGEQWTAECCTSPPQSHPPCLLLLAAVDEISWVYGSEDIDPYPNLPHLFKSKINLDSS